MSEDYAPFDIDVTTEDPGLEAIRRSSLNDAAYGVRVVISPGAAWYPAGGGVGFIGTFDAVFPGEDWPCFVFHDRLQSVPRYIGEAAAHEAGHTLGLNHDGTTNGVGYYEGQGDWAPIMGAAYYHNVTQWSKGEYSQANNQEDDLAVMVTNGAPLLADDHGNTIGAATTFDTNAGTATGLITTASDQDVFRLTVGAGTLRLRASTLALANGANVDLGLHLYDGQNNHLAGVNSDASIDATVTADVSAGTYYAVVSGTGSGTALTTGYSNYASLGNYTLALVEAPFTVTSPNGGENWATGSSHAITWTSTISGNVKLEYSTNSGSSWTQIVASTANDGTHTWSVPNTVTSQARVRVSSVLEPASNDASDGDFTIQTPQAGTIAVLAPNGGEVWTIGNAQSITWSSTNVTGSVKLEYSTNGGANWTIIAASTANDGTESWMVPNAATIQGRVRVTSASETTVKDASDANFAIQAPPATVTVTAPNGGESWTAGTSQAITWSSANLSGSVKLEYSATGGAPWTTIAASTANDGSENWTVPNAPTTQARVRISAVDAPSVSDTSNANFTITAVPIPTLTLLAPNGGQSLVVGATQ
ncbi:MAG: repeat-containing protein, partial [Armatimonadetes bacterium]|nr:repeat-containing protein [Armatimonadota bacterium]